MSPIVALCRSDLATLPCFSVVGNRSAFHKWQAVLAALEVESTRGTTWAVLEICTSLLEISADTGPQAWRKVCRPKRMALQEFAILSLFPPVWSWNRVQIAQVFQALLKELPRKQYRDNQVGPALAYVCVVCSFSLINVTAWLCLTLSHS